MQQVMNMVSAATNEPIVVQGACPHDCPDTCSMLITVEAGRATKVQGNPDHPYTQGTLCGKVNDYLDRVYSPERILYPMRRIGRKGSGQFERISWDVALDEITSRFRQVITEYGAQAILPCSYAGHEGLLNGINVGDAFFNRLGASISERTFCISSTSLAYLMTCGPSYGTDPDTFSHSKYIVLWGCNALSTNVHLWSFIQQARQNGAKLVVIDPVRTRTAKQADWHIQVRPGTDGALALGLMHTLMQENLIDADYVAQYTIGFAALKARASAYPPEKVAEITGVSATDIVRFAKEYATAQPSVIRLGVALEKQPGGGQGVRAICCLPALVGAWRYLGGGLLQSPMWLFPIQGDALHHPEFIQPGTRVLNQWHLGATLIGDVPLDPPIKALFIYNCNPVTQNPEQEKVIAGLSREDLFTVVSEQFMTDTADYADILLPATTQLENLDLMFSWGHAYLTLNTPAIAPLGEAVPNTELFRRLAQRIGFADACFTLNDEALALSLLDWSAPALKGIDMARLKREGYAKLNLNPVPHAEGNFPTTSGKCEFLSSMAIDSNYVLPVFRQGFTEFQPGEPIDPLPCYIPPQDASTNRAHYPLTLLAAKPHMFVNSCFGNLPKHRKLEGEPTMLIHPEAAAQRGITQGQLVQVFNQRGQFQIKAQVSDAVQPETIAVSIGHWRKLSLSHSTLNATTAATFADLGHTAAVGSTLVEVIAHPSKLCDRSSC